MPLVKGPLPFQLFVIFCHFAKALPFENFKHCLGHSAIAIRDFQLEKSREPETLESQF